jgi:hypothetical protein
MTALTRRHVLAGTAATVAAAALPAVAAVSDDYVLTPAVAKVLAKGWPPCWTCITWDGRLPSSRRAVWWEDRMHALLWKRVGDQWACLGSITDPVYSRTDNCGVHGAETYVQALPAWALDDDGELIAGIRAAEVQTDRPYMLSDIPEIA